MRRFAEFTMCCATVIFAIGAASVTVGRPITAHAGGTPTKLVGGGDNTCKVTRDSGACPTAVPGNCSSGIGGQNGCVFMGWVDDDVYFLCIKAGRTGTVENSVKLNFPECSDLNQNGHTQCRSVIFHCYQEHECDAWCDYDWDINGWPFPVGCVGINGTASNEGLVPTAMEANPLSNVCRVPEKPLQTVVQELP